jgi:hypothetical protein
MQRIFFFRAIADVRLRPYARKVYRQVRAGSPTCVGFRVYIREVGWLGSRKGAMSIVKKYRYGQIGPSRPNNEINGMVAIDVARLDQESAGGCNKLNGTPPDC